MTAMIQNLFKKKTLSTIHLLEGILVLVLQFSFVTAMSSLSVSVIRSSKVGAVLFGKSIFFSKPDGAGVLVSLLLQLSFIEVHHQTKLVGFTFANSLRKA